MKTIRLPDPFPRGKEKQKLEWGSSAWAADSCLVEWSRLEREWLGEPGGGKVGGAKPGLDWRRAVPGLRGLAVIAGTVVLLALAWTLLAS